MLGLLVPAVAAVVALAVLRGPRTTSPVDEQVQTLRACYRQIADLFPGQLEAMVLGPDGPQLQLSETPDVPDSPPIFVQVCSPVGRCAAAVSFSGRKIRLADRELELLANGNGEILLLAREQVWAAGQGPVGIDGWRYQAGWLQHN
jgi:hypothetical protein